MAASANIYTQTYIFRIFSRRETMTTYKLKKKKKKKKFTGTINTGIM